jgi:hypothetical protein
MSVRALLFPALLAVAACGQVATPAPTLTVAEAAAKEQADEAAAVARREDNYRKAGERGRAAAARAIAESNARETRRTETPRSAAPAAGER